ncbi:cytochrome ubiquinol oxidase subunit I [Ectobacillus polymachus]|uniref:cytochrome ubiquinol oxidase subunit I n=1 Tax=Ectobacillus polymachus TaxID=1508806 RepID=UPI003A8A76EC
MDVLLLSRIQFAVTIFYHFLFVPLTLGLVILVAIMETQHARTLNPLYRKMADFWGKLFTINFVMGIITGITMEFQFGTNWSEYSKYMGDIFGGPLAIEALVAFFLESTFMGIWIFGKDRISPKFRAFSMWMVAIGTNISAVWIITADGFMQHPVGYVVRNGRAELTDFWALISNSYAWHMFFHTVVSAYIVGSFFVMAISAYHLLRKQNVPFFMKSFKFALIFGLIAATATPLIGHESGINAAKMQPAKGAAMEAIWNTGTGQPFNIIQFPNVNKEQNFEALSIPKLGSFFYTSSFNGKVVGLKDIPKDERPNVNLVFYGFRAMVALGVYFMALTWFGFYLYRKGKIENSKRFLKLTIWSVLLPYVAINLGWMVTEVGRQPWTVYGLMKTAQSVSPISMSQIIFSIVSIILFYTLLLIADVYLILKYAKKGPEANLGSNEGDVDYVS